MHFGPLNRSGGERRLNVAVTRAREKVILVSSIRAADLDLSATQAPGVLALYRYLDYAERGPVALQLTYPAASGEFESPLERDVAIVIREMGYEVIPQVGCSGFRIDLGIVDPNEPGRFFLGVECDGATYHSSYTARDRDRLRQEVLEKLGWKIHRIWAPDWVTRRQTEVRRLREAIDRARRSLRGGGGQSPINEEMQPHNTPIVIRSQPSPLISNETFPDWTVPYKVCIPRTNPPIGIEFHDPAARETLANMLKEVIEVEGPVYIELAARRLAAKWELHKIGNRMMKAINAALRTLIGRGVMPPRRQILYPQRNDFILQVRRPDPANQETYRNINLIPPDELGLAIELLVRDAMSISVDDLLRQVARIFGFDRTGANIRGRTENILRQMIPRGAIVLRGDRISLP